MSNPSNRTKCDQFNYCQRNNLVTLWCSAQVWLLWSIHYPLFVKPMSNPSNTTKCDQFHNCQSNNLVTLYYLTQIQHICSIDWPLFVKHGSPTQVTQQSVTKFITANAITWSHCIISLKFNIYVHWAVLYSLISKFNSSSIIKCDQIHSPDAIIRLGHTLLSCSSPTTLAYVC